MTARDSYREGGAVRTLDGAQGYVCVSPQECGCAAVFWSGLPDQATSAIGERWESVRAVARRVVAAEVALSEAYLGEPALDDEGHPIDRVGWEVWCDDVFATADAMVRECVATLARAIHAPLDHRCDAYVSIALRLSASAEGDAE